MEEWMDGIKEKKLSLNDLPQFLMKTVHKQHTNIKSRHFLNYTCHAYGSFLSFPGISHNPADTRKKNSTATKRRE
jgi:hypothetical protein